MKWQPCWWHGFFSYIRHTNRKNQQRFENVSCENFLQMNQSDVTGRLETIFHMLFTVFHHAIVHDLQKMNYYD